jgi:hypothetical protein
MELKRLIVLLTVTAAIAACSSSDSDDNTSTYPGDAEAAIRSRCEAELTGKRECDSDCILAQLNLDCPASKELDGSSDFSAYVKCLAACPAAKMCSSSTSRALYECDCVITCARQRTKKTQGLLAFDADCERDKAGPVCN